MKYRYNLEKNILEEIKDGQPKKLFNIITGPNKNITFPILKCRKKDKEFWTKQSKDILERNTDFEIKYATNIIKINEDDNTRITNQIITDIDDEEFIYYLIEEWADKTTECEDDLYTLEWKTYPCAIPKN